MIHCILKLIFKSVVSSLHVMHPGMNILIIFRTFINSFINDNGAAFNYLNFLSYNYEHTWKGSSVHLRTPNFKYDPGNYVRFSLLCCLYPIGTFSRVPFPVPFGEYFGQKFKRYVILIIKYQKTKYK